MAWIRTVGVAEATGALAREYRVAIARAGKVFGIVRAMSPSPAVLKAAIGLYRALMFRESPLTRRQRELLATAVSVFNQCHY